MSTRAAAAANSSRIKQRLVRILFGKELSKQGRDAHRKLDHAAYSYDDLRKAFLKNIQLLHPDKSNSNEHFLSGTDNDSGLVPADDSGGWRDVEYAMERHKLKDSHEAFCDLKEAWDDYENIMRHSKKRDANDSKNQTNFTMFGVGCSFSDSPDEQRKRAEIMDQACRGWFTAGQIGEVEPTGGEKGDGLAKSPKWSTDAVVNETNSNEAPKASHLKEKNALIRCSLVDHMIRKQR